MVEHILYINLDYRTDRRDSIESVLSEFSYERIPAIRHELGEIGAYMSHIKSLEYAISKEWNHVLIMEDDMLWNEFDINYTKLKKLMCIKYDVIVLGGILVSHDTRTYKLHSCNSAGAYLVSKHYYRTLLANFKEGLDKLLKQKSGKLRIWENRNDVYHIDTYWHKLQQFDNWFIVPLCYSDEGYSDCEKAVRNWKPHFLMST
jgi:hypothetical protein